MMILSWIKLLISAAIFSCGSKSTRYAQAFVHHHHHRFAIKTSITSQQITIRYTSHLSSTPNEIEEGDDFFMQASQQASRQRFQQLKDGVSPLAVSLATTSITSSSDATDSSSSAKKEEGNDNKENKGAVAEESKPTSQEIKIPNEPQIKIPNEPPSIHVIKEAQEAIKKEIEVDKKQVVDPILQSIKNARPDSSTDVSQETNESETNTKTQEELEDELRSIKLGAKLAEDAERFWGSTSKDDKVSATQKDEKEQAKDLTPDEEIQEVPTAAKEAEKIRTEEDSTKPTEEKQSEPIFSIDTDEIVAQAMNIEEEGEIVDTNILGEEQKKANEDGEVKVPIDSVKKEDQSEDEIAPSADVEDTTTKEVPISSVEEDTTAEVTTSPTSSSDEQILMPSSSGEESIPRLSSDGKALYEPKQSEPGEVNQDNVDMGLLVLTQGLFALKSIVDKKE